MGFGSSPKMAAVTPAPPPATPATIADSTVAQSAASQRARAAAAAGMGSSGTVATSNQGITKPVKTGQANLLGE